MKRLGARGLLFGALIGAVLGPGSPVAGAGVNPMNDAGTLLAPQNGSTAAGVIALIGGSSNIAVGIAVSGLQPNSTHTAQIHSGGTCGQNGPVAFGLPNLSANQDGDAMAFTTIHASAVPAKGYYVVVLGDDPRHMPIACGNLANPDLAVPFKRVNGSKVTATALIALHAKVDGATTQLGTQVIVYATGLQPKTPQSDHIHAAMCGTPSPVRYPLLTLVPDAQGRAVAGTGITDIVPKSGLSIHIHDDTFKVVACGNIGT